MFWLGLLALAGVFAGAVVAHSLYLVLFLFVALGPLAAVGLARRAGRGWWLLVLTYSLTFGLGILLFPDGQTVPIKPWDQAAAATGITAVLGLLAGCLSQPD